MKEEASVDFEEIEGEIELSPPEIYAANLIEWAVDQRASDLFVSDSENSVIIAVRRLGKVQTVRRLARDYGHKLQGHLRVLAGSDAGDMLRPTEGRGVLHTPNGSKVDLRLSTIPTLYGQDVTIRLFDPVRGTRSLTELGYDSYELEILRKMLDQPAGLILVAGPVASGKSSTLYAALDALNDESRKIHTLEDPIEHGIAGVMQSQVNHKLGLDFADLLAVVLRHSPDVIMIGEIRDSRTANTAIRAGISGQLVLATIHAKSAAEAIDSLVQYEVNPKFVARSLVGVINQRLIRTLCPACKRSSEKKANEVPERLQSRVPVSPEHLFESVGCEECFGDGYQELTCVSEILQNSSEIEQAIATGQPATDIDAIAKQQGMLSLAETIATRVLRGETDLKEAQRCASDPSLSSLEAS